MMGCGYGMMGKHTIMASHPMVMENVHVRLESMWAVYNKFYNKVEKWGECTSNASRNTTLHNT